jgi:carbamoyl-phosphate synthase large subunit
MTSCSPRKNGLIHCLKDNPDGVSVKVYCTNCDPNELPSKNVCDGAFVVPRNSAPDYIDSVLELCANLNVDVLIPRLSSELEVIALNKDKFNALGVKVCVTDYDGLVIANDKAKLYARYSQLMPKQAIGNTSNEVREFAKMYPKFCCKLPHSSGAAGFAIVDDVLCDKVTLFHAYGYKHYISTDHLCRIVDTQHLNYILQEFIDGKDYTVSLVAKDGEVSHICGYVGYEMEFSCIMYGEIIPHQKAFEVSRKLVKDLCLSGNIGIDFILKPDGDVTLLEINPRMNATLPFVTKAGCNMPYLACKQLLGYDILHDGRNIQTGLKMRKNYVSEYFV